MFHRRFPSLAAAALFIFIGIAVPPTFAASAVIGVIEYLNGEVSLTRAGTVMKDVDIGFAVENFDLLKTGSDGEVIIALDKGTGFAGTMKIKPKSVFSVKTESVKGVPATEGDLIAGAVSVKETVDKSKKLAGTPSLRIRTTSTVMGVRGTEFDVSLSVNDSLLVGCSEGAVVCTGEKGDELEAVPGQAVSRSAGERLKRVPVAVSRLETFRKEWIAEELGVFKAAPLRAINQYATQYRRMKAEFNKAFEPLARDDSLSLWSSEHRKGVTPRANDVSVMKQKSALVPKLMAVRRVLFLFERVYYRLEDIREQVGPGALRSSPLSSGGTVAEFYKEFEADRATFEKKAAAYRFALRLFAERNEGRDVNSFMGDDDGGDFFDDTSSFFDD